VAFVLLLTALTLAAQLQSAQIEVQLGPGEARVHARYSFDTHDSTRLVLFKRPGQTLQDLSANRSELQVDERPGLTHLTTAPTSALELRYVIRGETTRIPLPVPDAAALPGPDRVRIRILGLDSTAQLRRAFPRFRFVNGSAEAILANVPSLLRLPPSDGALPLTRAVEWSVLVLLAGVFLAWILRFRRTRSG
jgi:hypothetical protein